MNFFIRRKMFHSQNVLDQLKNFNIFDVMKNINLHLEITLLIVYNPTEYQNQNVIWSDIGATYVKHF